VVDSRLLAVVNELATEPHVEGVAPGLRRWARRLLGRRTPIRWGSLRRTQPVSANYGIDRGRPVDRFYIEGFLARHAEDVRGRVLEVHDSNYTRRFGADDVTESVVVDVDEANPQATLLADLAEPGSLPSGRYDCVILTQTLQYMSAPGAALHNVWEALAPGGTALITVPCLSRIDPDLADIDRWRFTPQGLETLLVKACQGADVEIVSRGNVLVGVAFHMGLAADELKPAELGDDDELFPLVACARVRKPK
jgi:hypothetical protein